MSAPLTLLLAGHVDHGKSTLAGALLHALGALPEGKAESVRAHCEQRGVAFEWAFVLDALQLERAQGITLDAAYAWFATKKRRYALIDAPGHHEFLRNLMTGATQADAALLVLDARAGLEEQSRRHAYLLQMLGIRQVVVAVNKMDAVEYAQSCFADISAHAQAYLREIGLHASAIVPVSARESEGLTHLSARMKWFDGHSLTDALDALTPPASLDALPLRLPVQDVYKTGEKRIIVGQIASGHMRVGDAVTLAPGGKQAHIASIETWPPSDMQEASCGASIGLTLDAPLFAERGMLLCHAADAPAPTRTFRARVFWLSDAPLLPQNAYGLRFGPLDVHAHVQTIHARVHPDTLEQEENAPKISSGLAGEVTFALHAPAPIDTWQDNSATGRFVVLENSAVAGAGWVETIDTRPVSSTHITPQHQQVSLQARALANGHLPGIFWFSGLSGSGKSTLAQAAQNVLFSRGCQVFVLDGDNLRRGLSRDLGFSALDRREHLRRAAETAALFAQAGFIVLAAFISPTEEERVAARACAPQWFHDVYINANLSTCEQRDAKGLYALARAGKIAEFTGISAPFEVPAAPDLAIDTQSHGIDACTSLLVEYIERICIAPLKRNI